MEIDDKGRLSLSIEEVRELNKRGLVEVMDLPRQDLESTLTNGIAMKVLDEGLGDDEIRLDKFTMRRLMLRKGDTMIVRSMMNDKEFPAIVGEVLLDCTDKMVLAMNPIRKDELAIYEGGYCLMRSNFGEERILERKERRMYRNRIVKSIVSGAKRELKKQNGGNK